MSVLPQTSNGTPPSAATPQPQQALPAAPFIEPTAAISQDAEKFTSLLLQQNLEISKLVGDDISVRTLLDDNLRIVFLVGTGQDGKTTLYKSFKAFAGSFSQADKFKFKKLIHAQVCISVKQIGEYILKSQSKTMNPEEQQELKLHLNELLGETSTSVKKACELFKDKRIQEAYKQRNQAYHIPELDYFINNPLICDDKFEPTVEDIMHCRVKTSGVFKNEYTNVNNYSSITMFDFGAERVDRKKWIQALKRENPTDILYVVAADSYFMPCTEDCKLNRFRESLRVWEENVKPYITAGTNVYLIFNKVDLFLQRLEEYNFSTYFEEYAGNPRNPEQVLTFMVHEFLNTCLDLSCRVHVCTTSAVNMKMMNNFWQMILSLPHAKPVKNASSKSHDAYSEKIIMHEHWQYQAQKQLGFSIYFSNFCNVKCNIFQSDWKISTAEPKLNFYVHSFLIHTFYPKLHDFFAQLMQNGVILVKNMSYATLRHILSLIYTGDKYKYPQTLLDLASMKQLAKQPVPKDWAGWNDKFGFMIPEKSKMPSLFSKLASLIKKPQDIGTTQQTHDERIRLFVTRVLQDSNLISHDLLLHTQMHDAIPAHKQAFEGLIGASHQGISRYLFSSCFDLATVKEFAKIAYLGKSFANCYAPSNAMNIVQLSIITKMSCLKENELESIDTVLEQKLSAVLTPSSVLRVLPFVWYDNVVPLNLMYKKRDKRMKTAVLSLASLPAEILRIVLSFLTASAKITLRSSTDNASLEDSSSSINANNAPAATMNIQPTTTTTTTNATNTTSTSFETASQSAKEEVIPPVQLCQASQALLLFSPELHNYVIDQYPAYLMFQSKKAKFAKLRNACFKYIRANMHAVGLYLKKATNLDAEMMSFIESSPASYGVTTNVDSVRNSVSSIEEMQ